MKFIWSFVLVTLFASSVMPVAAADATIPMPYRDGGWCDDQALVETNCGTIIGNCQLYTREWCILAVN